MKLTDVPTPIWWALVIGVGALVVYHVGKRGLAAAGDAVNITSDKNLAYSGVNDLAEAVGKPYAIHDLTDWLLGSSRVH